MRKIKYIVIHCSAGYSLIPSIENFWYKPKSKGGLGWKSPGYSVIIYEDGTTWYVGSDNKYTTDINKWDLNKVTNGVAGFNTPSVHISYIGGVEKNNVNKAKDSRTPEQKEAILKVIKEVYESLKEYQEVGGILIRGHRDFSPDKNNNNIIEPWERIKECPSFDVISEYGWIQGTEALKHIKLI